MKLLSLMIAIMLGLALSVGAQTTTDEQQQQPPPSKGNAKVQQTTDQPAGPMTGHPNGEKMKDTSQPTRMKSGAAVNAKS